MSDGGDRHHLARGDVHVVDLLDGTSAGAPKEPSRSLRAGDARAQPGDLAVLGRT